MITTSGSERCVSLWGKLRRERTGAAIHPLADHCLDVAQVLRALAGTARGDPLGLDDPAQIDRLAVLALLHDLGKCNWGFQAKINERATLTAGHVVEAIALLRAPSLWPPPFGHLLQQMCGWFVGGDEQLVAMLVASVAHHGRPVSWDQDYQRAGGQDLERWWQRPAAKGAYPSAGLIELSELARATFPRAFADDVAPIDASPTMQRIFSGLVMLADWIGSDTTFFPYRCSADENRHQLAVDAAQRALNAIGLLPPEERRSAGFLETFGFAPSPLQQRLSADAAIDEARRLMLVESDTGSGKTEVRISAHRGRHFRLIVDAISA